VFDNGEYICSGIVDLNKSKLPTYERSFEMAKRLWKVLEEYKPDHLVIEDTQQQNNVKTVIILARLQGMLIGYAEAHGIKVHILLPSQWRAALGYTQGPKVKREALKQQSIDYVKNNFELDLPEDQAEATCIAEAAHKIYNFTIQN
jgi:Holliday junction resolvasome RuvABC endonuclease subunit